MSDPIAIAPATALPTIQVDDPENRIVTSATTLETGDVTALFEAQLVARVGGGAVATRLSGAVNLHALVLSGAVTIEDAAAWRRVIVAVGVAVAQQNGWQISTPPETT